MEVYLLALFGLFGGLIRALVGIFKHKVFTGKEKFRTGKFIFTLIISALIGLFCALLLLDDYRIALLAGYAGTDLIQGIYKITRK